MGILVREGPAPHPRRTSAESVSMSTSLNKPQSPLTDTQLLDELRSKLAGPLDCRGVRHLYVQRIAAPFWVSGTNTFIIFTDDRTDGVIVGLRPGISVPVLLRKLGYKKERWWSIRCWVYVNAKVAELEAYAKRLEKEVEDLKGRVGQPVPEGIPDLLIEVEPKHPTYLREVRTKAGVSMGEVARSLGCSVSRVSGIEQGMEATPREAALYAKLDKAYDDYTRGVKGLKAAMEIEHKPRKRICGTPQGEPTRQEEDTEPYPPPEGSSE